MRDGFIRKKVQKVVSKTGVQIKLPPNPFLILAYITFWHVALQVSLTEVIREFCKNF